MVKKKIFSLIGIGVVLIGLSGCFRHFRKQGISSLPASLDQYFPPQAKQPDFLYKMYAIAMPMEGMMVDVFENDYDNSLRNFNEFKKNYVEASEMVPEWKCFFNLKAVDKLEEALKTKDQKKIMGAVGGVGKTCKDCHSKNMVLVMQKYHWGDFGSIKVRDPYTKEDLSFAELMQYMAVSFAGIGSDLKQGQGENASRQFNGFKARFQALNETCKECHKKDTPNAERKYYTDKTIMDTIDQLGEIINRGNPDPKIIGDLTQTIGTEVCFKCHLVHIPPAFAQHKAHKHEHKHEH